MRRLGIRDVSRAPQLASLAAARRQLSATPILHTNSTPTSRSSSPHSTLSRSTALHVWLPQPRGRRRSNPTPSSTLVSDEVKKEAAAHYHPLPPTEMSVISKLRSLFRGTVNSNAGSSSTTSPSSEGSSLSSSSRGIVGQSDDQQLPPLPRADDTHGGVPWSCHERLDFYFSFWAPQGWTVREMVRENFISIQVSPPVAEMDADTNGETHKISSSPAAPVHGISITAFAYHKKVKHPDSGTLLRSFVKRFSTQVDPNLRIVQFYDAGAEEEARKQNQPNLPSPGSLSLAADSGRDHHEEVSDGGDEKVSSRLSVAHEIGGQIGGSVCEVAFSPRAGPTSPQRNAALGVCRAFYHPNGRFHYVVLAAVPSSEFDLVADQVKFAVMAARETMSPVADSS